MLDAAGSGQGANISITKNIPVAAGLGGVEKERRVVHHREREGDVGVCQQLAQFGDAFARHDHVGGERARGRQQRRAVNAHPRGPLDAVPPPPYKVPLFDPPPPARLQGWSFIEFAVDPAAGAVLAAWLARAGFVRMGHHRSKQVDLYGQGEVRIVLNLEADSFARKDFLQ